MEIQDVSLQRVLTRTHPSYQPIPACEIPPTTTALRGCTSDSHPLPSSRTLWSESTPEKGSRGTCTHSTYSPCALSITPLYVRTWPKGATLQRRKKMWLCCLRTCAVHVYHNTLWQLLVSDWDATVKHWRSCAEDYTLSSQLWVRDFLKAKGKKVTAWMRIWTHNPKPSAISLSLYIHIISIYSLLLFFCGGGGGVGGVHVFCCIFV